MSATFNLRPYLRAAKEKHANRDAIYETVAEASATPEQLAHLADALRHHDPKGGWKVPAKLRRPLVDGLLDANWTATKIAIKTGISRTTIHNAIRRRTATAQAGGTNRMNKRRNCPVSGGRVSLPVLSFSARGTPWSEHRQILETLGLLNTEPESA